MSNNELYDAYKEQGGEKSEDEVMEILTEDILDRYLNVEYFDLSEIRQTVDG